MPEHSIRVLLVEDTFSDAALFQRMLSKSKMPVFEVTSVTDLSSGKKALTENKFDVVLLDLGLPDSIGATTVAKLRAVDPSVAIIILTVIEAAQTILDAIKLGAQDYFVKSRLDADELMNKIIDAVIWRNARLTGPLGDAAPYRTGGRTVRLLVVEDEDTDFTLLGKMLSSIKLVRFEVLRSSSLADALTQLRSGVDAVVLDLNLPDCQGLETLRRMRTADSTTPIVLLTRVEERDIAVTALKQGAQDYLLKGHVDGASIGQSLLRHLKKP
jgi:DNA-binding response OmpR family regulator